MKYGILEQNRHRQAANDHESVGFYQWLNVFQGQMIQVGDALDKLRDGDFDIISIRLTRENLDYLHQIKARFGEDSVTKIAVSLDIPALYWKKEFGDASRVKSAILKADFVSATQVDIARDLAELSGKNVYEIPHPAHLDQIKAVQSIEQKDIATIFYGGKANVIRCFKLITDTFPLDLKVRVLAYRYETPDEINDFRARNIDFIICRNETELGAKLAESRFIVIPEADSFYVNEYHNYENLIVYSAALGAIVLGPNHWGAMRHCYREMANNPSKNFLKTYNWMNEDAVKLNNLMDDAQVRVKRYDLANSGKRFLDWLYYETKDERFQSKNLTIGFSPLAQQIHHVWGERTVNYHPEEFAVVCLVKNGAEYIKTFMEHYQRLGANHFYFIDNGSTDATITLLKQYRNVTIYHTELPHKQYECEIRRAMIEEHCRDKWCLCVDIDELFDYPYSETVSMRHFLGYLNSRRFTAVLSYMLDLFSEEMRFSPASAPSDLKPEENMIERYCFYDISHIRKTNYNASLIAFTHANRLADRKMMNYSGGIRWSAFGNKEDAYLLTKHPLIFVDSKIEPVVHPHFCNQAFVADVNGVLKHYKFIDSFKDKVIRSLNAGDYCHYAEQEYKEYLKAIQDKNALSLYSRKSQKLEHTDQLVRQGFLRVSKAYRAYIKGIGSRKPG